jgi:hypothetical protein
MEPTTPRFVNEVKNVLREDGPASTHSSARKTTAVSISAVGTWPA